MKTEKLSARSSKPSAYVFSAVIIGALGWAIMKNLSMSHAVSVTVGAILLAGLCLLALTNLEMVLLAFLAYLPFSKQLPGGFGEDTWAFNLTNIFFFICLGGWLFSVAGQRRSLFRWHAIDGPILLFCLLGIVSLLRAAGMAGAWYWWEYITPLKQWLTPIFLYFFFVSNFPDRESIKRALSVICIAVSMVSVMAIRDFLNVGDVSDVEKMRIGGVMDQPNTLGGFFCYYAFLLGALWLLNLARPGYWLLLIPFALIFRAVTVTFSRGALVAFFAGTGALAFFRHWAMVLLLALGVGVAMPVIMQNPPDFLARLSSTFQTSTDSYSGEVTSDFSEESLDASSRTRLIIWQGARAMIQEHPLMGVGYGLFPKLVPYYVPLREERDAHNAYLLIAAEMGLPALAVFVLILLMALWAGWRLYRASKDKLIRALGLGFSAGMVSLLIVNCFGSRFDDQAAIGYFWVLIAMVVRARDMLKAGEIT